MEQNSKYHHLTLQKINDSFSYLLLREIPDIQKLESPYFYSCTIDEHSLVVKTKNLDLILDSSLLKRNDDWICFRTIGQMPFGSVQGLISYISTNILQNSECGVCVYSTYLADYFLVKTRYWSRVENGLTAQGWSIDYEEDKS